MLRVRHEGIASIGVRSFLYAVLLRQRSGAVAVSGSAPAEAARKPDAPTGTVLRLPPAGPGASSLDFKSAEDLSARYFRKYVAVCGMPDSPMDRGSFWCVQLWGGYPGSDYGRMWLAKDGSSVLLEAPKKGFHEATKSMLMAEGVRYE